MKTNLKPRHFRQFSNREDMFWKNENENSILVFYAVSFFSLVYCKHELVTNKGLDSQNIGKLMTQLLM